MYLELNNESEKKNENDTKEKWIKVYKKDT